ncbi:MAG: heterodisulfide reductase-related iron-sulfur binding cluster [Chloroflexota bacterium]|nr:heterodisulfide reductase-related iron-sulfur binding cluster [Dehalococcoidia bacterium]MDW8254714.1 heterodisulfide reductase-related iron-sulfur binding cluster [Chloroflexota bacterium]
MSGAAGPGFDPHRPPERRLIGECVHCGFCLPTCPTYLLWGLEPDSPRGRIDLMAGVLDGAIGLTPATVAHFDQCLGCLACVTACPSGVQYGRLIERARAQIERNAPRSRADRLFRAAIFLLFPHPGRLRALLPLLRAYQASGLRALLDRSGLLARLPERLQAMESLLPPVPARIEPLPRRTPPARVLRLRVGLLVGCVQRIFFGEVNAATARVLAAEGCEVIVPAQGCCGALELHAGRDAAARARARRLIAAFERAGVDRVVVNAAGCGSTLKEYGELLADEPRWARRAARFAATVRDIAEVLAELPPLGHYRPLPLRVAYHDACHLLHGQRIYRQPRDLLARVPELTVVELAEPEICCGSAGVYNLLQPAPARALGDRKAAGILASGAEALASGNPGCLLHLARALARAGRPLPTYHPVQLLDASLRGATLPASR